MPMFSCLAFLPALLAASDPQLSSWMTQSSGRYARLYQTTADKTAQQSVTTWPSSGLPDQGGGQAIPAYADVQRVESSSGFVYVNVTGLASYTMGPWLAPNGSTFMFWPTNRNAIHRIPRSPAIPATKSATPGGPVGLWVNGVALFNDTDAQSYTTSAGQVGMQGQGIWNRIATYGEATSFDPAQAHSQQQGQYHNHTNPLALRYALSDHVTFSGATQSYAEASTSPAHSPILGWAHDGLPIYGPFGYSAPMDPTSGVRRMVAGFIKRDGTAGTTNLNATGRTILPAWAAALHNLSAQLASAQYGPAISTTYPLGTFQEDYDYLGDLGKTQGADFDLNRQNARFGVTPDYPNGTWAYFVSLDSNYASAYPDVIGATFYGSPTGGLVNSIAETVTEYERGGQASPIAVTAVVAGGKATITWTSVEGGTYQIETSNDGTTFTVLAAGIASGGLTTTTTTATLATTYRVMLTALATYDPEGTGGISGLNGTGTAIVGSTGTAHLVNLSTSAETGGSAGTPATGFTIGGSGSKRVLVRAIGPGLAPFGVTGWLPDPSLTLVGNGTTVASDDNWNAADAATFAAVSAFALTPGSADAALVTTLGTGLYSAPVGSNGGAGLALLEVYDADPATGTASLINASTRAFVGSGNQTLAAGFIVSGTGTQQLLIRGIGPALAGFGVSGVLPDPQIVLYQGATVVASNDNWGSAANAALMAAAAAQAGAFALTSGSKDAAVLVSLPAGAYSAVVTGVGGATGTGLVEIYVIP